jgi:VanZ family protein
MRTHFVIITICFGALFAALDEWHQLHVPWRYASVFDVIADAVGVILGVLIFSWSIFKLKIFGSVQRRKDIQ